MKMQTDKLLTALPFNEDGFLIEPNLWNRDIAQQIAYYDGLGQITKPQWQVLYYLREHYLDLQCIPPMGHLCHVLGQEKHCVEHLFHSEKEAWRVAGLPDPGGEAKTLMI